MQNCATLCSAPSLGPSCESRTFRAGAKSEADARLCRIAPALTSCATQTRRRGDWRATSLPGAATSVDTDRRANAQPRDGRAPRLGSSRVESSRDNWLLLYDLLCSGERVRQVYSNTCCACVRCAILTHSAPTISGIVVRAASLSSLHLHSFACARRESRLAANDDMA